MISFGLTEEQEVVREAMKEFADQVLRPIARDCDEESNVSDEVLQQVWELGLTSTQLPEAYGGAGEPRSHTTNALILEELGCGDASLAIACVSPSLFAFPVADFGTEEQKAKYLPLFASEQFHAASMALIEPSPVFDVLDLKTTAEPKGDVFALSGTKRFVPLGDRASHILVVARNIASAAEGFDAIDAFIVPRDAKGLTVSEVEKNLGLKPLQTFSLELDEVEVPAADRLGGEDGIDARRLLASSRVALASVMVGLSRAVMEYCVPYAKDRVAFDQAIAQKQAIAFKLSSMAIETDAMRWLTWKAASQLEGGVEPTQAASFALNYAAEQAMKIADDGVQVLGGHGYIRDHPVEMWFRNARTLGVLEGTVAV